MKILTVNKFLFKKGGSETYILKLGEQLKNMGCEVQYFGMEHQGNCVFNNAGQYTSDMDFHTASPLKKISYSLKTVYSKEAKAKIKAVLNDFKPDVVHLNNFNYQLTPSIILGIKEFEKESGKKIKTVYTAHDYQLICPNHMLYSNNEICEKCTGGNFNECLKNKCIHGSAAKSLMGTIEAKYWNKRRVYENIDTVICPTEFMKNKLETNPIFRGKTVVLHNFTDNEATIDKDAQTSKKDDYVLYFGRFDEEKGVKLFDGLNDINLVCAGAGNLEDFINSLPNAKNVGFKTGEELNELIKNAACTIYPSIWYENCPFSVMESINSGTPVVGANIGGIPELIKNGENGFLFEPGNKKDLALKVKMILNNKNLAREMSENCFNTKFDNVREYAEKLIEIYTK